VGLPADFGDAAWMSQGRISSLPPEPNLISPEKRVNDQYRIVFRFEGGDAFDVLCTDYH
jgi:plasmid maintenance system killer protein